MDAAGLRALQAPIKERYKADPKAGFITHKAKGTLDDANIACIQRPAGRGSNCAQETCCSKLWSPAPA